MKRALSLSGSSLKGGTVSIDVSKKKAQKGSRGGEGGGFTSPRGRGGFTAPRGGQMNRGGRG